MDNRITRRQAFAQAVGPRVRLAPRDQLVNTIEYEEQARRVLSPAMASLITDQKAYAAAARIITTVDQMLDTLLRM